jgi:hypothetical protein
MAVGDLVVESVLTVWQEQSSHLIDESEEMTATFTLEVLSA